MTVYEYLCANWSSKDFICDNFNIHPGAGKSEVWSGWNKGRDTIQDENVKENKKEKEKEKTNAK